MARKPKPTVGRRSLTDAPTWHEKSKAWRKRATIDGKQVEFRYKHEHTAAGAARASADWQHDLERVRRQNRANELLRSVRVTDAPTWKQTVKQAVSDLIDGKSDDEIQQRALAMASARMDLADGKLDRAATNLSQFATPKTKTKTTTVGTMAGLLEEYKAHQQQRADFGKKYPNAPKSERISQSRLTGVRWSVKRFMESFGSDDLPTTEAELAGVLLTFRQAEKSLVAKGKISPATFNIRMRDLKHFVNWSWRSYRLPSLPRNASELFAQFKIEPKAKAIDLDDLAKIWSKATDRQRCYIALALNCGMYATDIATLKHEQITADGRLNFVRNKTKESANGGNGVMVSFKLWEITKRLVKEHATGEEDIAFVNADGKPLLSFTEAGSRIDNIGLQFKRAANLAGVKASFSQLRDTAATAIEAIDRKLTDTFLAHADARIARFYVDGDKIDTAALFADLAAATDTWGQTVEDKVIGSKAGSRKRSGEQAA